MKEKHQTFYERDGKNYVSVTSVFRVINNEQLNEWKLTVGKQRAEEISARGMKVGKDFHEYVDKINKGDGFTIDTSKMIDPIKSMVERYRLWFYENVKEVILSEQRVYSNKHLYCGRIDNIYLLKDEKVPVICDIKTANWIGKTESWQLSAYKEAVEEDLNIKTKTRIILNVKKDGTFNEIRLSEKQHERDFHCFLYAKELFNEIYGSKK